MNLGLYKIFFYFQSCVHESIFLSFFRPACIFHTVAILFHDYWEIYDPPSTSLLYAIHHIILVIKYRVKAKMNPRGGCHSYGILCDSCALRTHAEGRRVRVHLSPSEAQNVSPPSPACLYRGEGVARVMVSIVLYARMPKGGGTSELIVFQVRPRTCRHHRQVYTEGGSEARGGQRRA